MTDAPSYFDNVYEDEWIEDEFVKEMILDVDKSKVISAHIIESPIFGAITLKDLSGGVKVLTGKTTLLHMLYEYLRVGWESGHSVSANAESFEYLLLKSGVIYSKDLPALFQQTSQYIDSEKYVSWERFFTELAEKTSAEMGHPYTKDHLSGFYLIEKNIRKVIGQFPKEILPN